LLLRDRERRALPQKIQQDGISTGLFGTINLRDYYKNLRPKHCLVGNIKRGLFDTSV